MTCLSVEALPDLLLCILTPHNFLGVLWFELCWLLYRRSHSGMARPRARTRSKLKITGNSLEWERDSWRW